MSALAARVVMFSIASPIINTYKRGANGKTITLILCTSGALQKNVSCKHAKSETFRFRRMVDDLFAKKNIYKERRKNFRIVTSGIK